MIVQVIHCGSQQDIKTLNYLKQLTQECKYSWNKLDFQHLTFREEKERAGLIHTEVEKHKKINVIVLISRSLFEIMWISRKKRAFLKMITLMKKCVHIWLDVDEEIVRRHSTTLLRRDLNFGRIHIEELSGNPDDKISTLHKLLRTSMRTEQNYAVDEQGEHKIFN